MRNIRYAIFSLSLLTSSFLSIHANDVLDDRLKGLLIKYFPTEQPLGHEIETPKSSSTKKFYTGYLAKYYPKAMVIGNDLFINMTPQQINDALSDIVEVLSETPWFYFFDKKDGFKTATYWEFIVDQCSIINNFLKQIRVDLVTRKLVLHDPLNFALKKNNKSKPLISFMYDEGYTGVCDFYALSFDYLLKLFNEGIFTNDFQMADYYYRELDFVAKKLIRSKYEADYFEATKTCKELINILKTKHQKEIDAYYETHYGAKL